MTIASVFVNGRPRPAIMENLKSRIERGDIKIERQEAIQVNYSFDMRRTTLTMCQAMCDIAIDRAAKLQSQTDKDHEDSVLQTMKNLVKK
jgi:hypothetical protein